VNDLTEIEDRLRRTYSAVARTTTADRLADLGDLEEVEEVDAPDEVDAMDAPDEVGGVAALHHRRASAAERRRGRHRRLRVRLAAAAVVVALGGLAVAIPLVAHRGEDGDDLHAGTDADRPEPLLPGAPIPARNGHAAVWTGHEMIVFGGYDDNDEDGHADETDPASRADGAAAYDPARRAWRELADPPDEIKGAVAAVWTGHEVVAFSIDTRRLNAAPDDALVAATYDPDADEWHTLDVPLDGYVDWGTSFLWTGDRVLIAGISPTGPTAFSADAAGVASYDPATDRWAELPDAPVPLTSDGGAVWTGDEMVYVGPDTPIAESRVSVPTPTGMTAVALDPATRTWRTLPAPPLSARMETVVAWTGHELVVVGGYPASRQVGAPDYVDGATYDPATGQWTPLPDAPASPYRAEVVRGRLVVRASNDPQHRFILLDLASRTWSFGPVDPLPDLELDVAVTTGDEILAWSGHEANSVSPAVGEGYAFRLP
jgi:hypothetical protein